VCFANQHATQDIATSAFVPAPGNAVQKAEVWEVPGCDPNLGRSRPAS